MLATNGAPSDWRSELALKPRDFRFAGDWLRRTGGMVGTNPDAWLFFVARLRRRRRTGMWLSAAVALIFAAVIAVHVWRGWGDRSFGGAQLALVFILVGALCVVAVTREDRASARLAAVIGTRTSRERDISLAEVIGRLRLATFEIVFAAQTCFVAAVFLGAPAHYGADVALLFVVEWATVAALVAGSVRRPSIAIDAESLALDERLRSCDASLPFGFTYMGATGFVALVGTAPDATLILLAFGLEILGLAAQLLAFFPRRWPNPYQHRAWWTA